MPRARTGLAGIAVICLLVAWAFLANDGARESDAPRTPDPAARRGPRPRASSEAPVPVPPEPPPHPLGVSWSGRLVGPDGAPAAGVILLVGEREVASGADG